MCLEYNRCHLNNIINECLNYFFMIGNKSFCKRYIVKIVVSFVRKLGVMLKIL